MEMEKQAATKDRAEMVKSFLGPKGGLPSLKGDLVKLAALLHIPVTVTDTIDDLKKKIRPLVADLKGPSTAAASSQVVSKKEDLLCSTPPRPTRMEPAATSPESSKSSWSPVGVDLTTISHLMDTKMKEAMEDQTSQFQTMLAQVMAHVEHRFQQTAGAPLEMMSGSQEDVAMFPPRMPQ